ncbi:unnamed protein product [Mytilus edulis]|uniref:Uncharacterized protein n=1 Tax=Mytilus edulis TaxID=6550 RepID=A0A8S3UD89_MYTED|nr:unnamed protein product [Mytilus edulis]
MTFSTSSVSQHIEDGKLDAKLSMLTKICEATESRERSSSREFTKVKDYLSKGANINCSDWSGKTSLFVAAENGNLDIVQSLLERTNTNPNKGNKRDGKTPLHVATANGNLEIVQLLLQRTDTDPDKESKAGDTLLHSAASGGHPNILQLLIERTDLDPNTENKVLKEVIYMIVLL